MAPFEQTSKKQKKERISALAPRLLREHSLLLIVGPTINRCVTQLRALAEATAEDRERLTIVIVGTWPSLLPADVADLSRLGWSCESAKEGDTLCAGMIVTLSDPELTRLQDNRLARAQHELERRAPVDALLSSIASSYGDRALVTLLATREGDGIRGLQAIAQAGGTTLALDDCVEARLANAAGLSTIDELLSAELVAERVLQYLSLPKADSDVLHAAVIDYFGLEADDYRVPVLARRVQRRMRAHGIARPTEYTQLLDTDSVEAARIVREVLLRGNRFFANPAECVQLQLRVLPELVSAATGRTHLRVWVPGCATGEEVYSLAILLTEALEQLGADNDLRVFATDIDDSALAVARQGWYPRSIEEDVAAPRLRRYFHKDKDAYHVAKRVRDCVLFATHRLGADPPFGKLDLISCHDLLGYLNREQRKRALLEFHYALLPHGRLLVGRDDVLADWHGLFEPEDLEHGILRRVNSSVAALPMQALPVRAVKRPAQARPPVSTSSRSLEQELLNTQAAPLVVFNTARRITLIAGSVGRYLQPPCGVPTEDVLAMTRPELREHVAALLSTPVQGLRSTQHVVQLDGDELLLELELRRLERAEPLFALAFHDRTQLLRQVATVMRDEPPSSTTRKAAPAVSSDSQDIQNLQVVNEELWSQNQDLHATNRKLELWREEQTSTCEAQESTIQLLREQVESFALNSKQRSELEQHTGVRLVMLDSQLRILSYTPAALELFRLIPADVGRPLSNIAHELGDDAWLEDARRAIATNTRAHRVIRASNARSYVLDMVSLSAATEQASVLALQFEEVREDEHPQLRERLGQLERELEQSRSSSSPPPPGSDYRVAHAERFAASIAHEINNPLGNIALAADQAVASLTNNNLAKTKELLLNVRDNAFRCGRIVESVLRLARDEPAQHAPTKFNSIPRRAASMVRNYVASGKLRVAFALGEPDPEIRCNATELEQVFVNLLNNAAQAHPRTCHVVIRSIVKSNELRVFVSDDGPGIAAADVTRIFEPFFSTQRKSGGTGLGLSITKQIVANHGGTISVSTAPGRGATFELRFPRQTDGH